MTKEQVWNGSALFCTIRRIVLKDVNGNILCDVSGYSEADKWCEENGYTLRMSGSSQTSDENKILKELKALDEKGS